MKLCDYGCDQEAKYQFKNGKWCCKNHWLRCPVQRKMKSIQVKEMWKDPNNELNSILCKEKQSIARKKAHKDLNSIYNSTLFKKKKSIKMKKNWEDPKTKRNLILGREKLKLTIKIINKKYPFFSKIEEMRYNPDKLKEIQVHCKNNNCKNSKEKGGWFTPTSNQIYHRANIIENPKGIGESNFYCSRYCKDTCLLYWSHGSDPYKDSNKPHTTAELNIFNKYVLKRDNEICYYCGEHANTVHHLRPQKLEPFFALDPDYARSCCEKCHYKYGHPTGSDHSTGNLAKVICSTESQKFLKQTL